MRGAVVALWDPLIPGDPTLHGEEEQDLSECTADHGICGYTIEDIEDFEDFFNG